MRQTLFTHLGGNPYSCSCEGTPLLSYRHCALAAASLHSALQTAPLVCCGPNGQRAPRALPMQPPVPRPRCECYHTSEPQTAPRAGKCTAPEKIKRVQTCKISVQFRLPVIHTLTLPNPHNYSTPQSMCKKHRSTGHTGVCTIFILWLRSLVMISGMSIRCSPWACPRAVSRTMKAPERPTPALHDRHVHVLL